MSYKIIHSPVSPSSPNHMILPVIVYSDIQNNLKQTVLSNDWVIKYESTVFDYHHYHDNTHEWIGVKSGYATLMIGGENGQKVNITEGQSLLLPAGYGHRLLESSQDFTVYLAYPGNISEHIDTTYDDIKQVNSIINQVPLPKTDPIEGRSGPMFKEWHNIYHCNTFN